MFAVDLKTGNILRFETQSEAARQLGIDVGLINNVVNGKQYQTGGYLFTENESEITEEKIQDVKDNMKFQCGIIAINLDIFKVFLFESQHEAVASLNRVIKEKQNTAGRCWFTRVDENAIEKVKANFGDDIAEKVKELMSENHN